MQRHLSKTTLKLQKESDNALPRTVQKHGCGALCCHSFLDDFRRASAWLWGVSDFTNSRWLHSLTLIMTQLKLALLFSQELDIYPTYFNVSIRWRRKMQLYHWTSTAEKTPYDDLFNVYLDTYIAYTCMMYMCLLLSSFSFTQPAIGRTVPYISLVPIKVFLPGVTCIGGIRPFHPIQIKLAMFGNLWSWSPEKLPSKINSHSYQANLLFWPGTHHFIHTQKPTDHQRAHTHSNSSPEIKFENRIWFKYSLSPCSHWAHQPHTIHHMD